MGDRKRRLSRTSIDVLTEFLAQPNEPLYGLELMKSLGIGGGTLYPILQRFEDEKWLEADWEDADPRAEGRPRRRYYKMTALGQEVARAEVRRASGRLQSLKWGLT